MATMDYGAEAVNNKSEAKRLQDERLSRYLDDKNGPMPLSALAVQGSERRQRALAELLGIFAGFTYLEKMARGDVTQEAANEYHPTPQRAFNYRQNPYIVNQFTEESGILFLHDPEYPNLEEFEASGASESKDDSQPQQSSRQADSTDEIKLAWSGLRGVRKGLKRQHQRLQDIASKSSSANIRKLLDAYISPKRMGEMGILAYRDVLDFIVPDTLAEVVAFTSLSYVISNLLLQRGRIAETDVLSGIQRWGDCIVNVDDRKAFASFASEMWPLEHLRTMNEVAKSNGQDDDKDSNRSRSKHPAADNRGSLELPNVQSTPQAIGGSSTSKEIREAALLNSYGLETLPETRPSALIQHPYGSPSLDNDVLNIMNQTWEEYDFSQFSSLPQSPAFTAGGPGFHHDELSPRPGVDPKSMDYYWSGLSLELIPSQTFSPMPDPPLPAPSAPAVEERASVGSEVDKRHIINFQCFNRDSDTAIFKLRDTPMFLAVLVFSHDTGDFFYRLSGCGKTVHCTKRSSAYTIERSKAEKRLRKEVFDPMKKSESGNVAFLALLSVAKRFVVLGSLGTLKDVQDYLVAISREVIEPGQEYEKFVRWVYSSSTTPHSCMESPPDTKTNQDAFPSMAQDEQIHQQIYQCEVPNCTKTYKTGSGLWKHKQKQHEKDVVRIACPHAGCTYEDIRRDLVRLHYQRLHSLDLPAALKAGSRGQKRQRVS
ncbi:hypothetical protein CORC01_10305 [Colletotrichum orchidophilum]|uniref:C2H2-type domain-containing protein n=1 Tax=Colletotrichum orchidophilum TaxID=1209926 RepID=A0A1G4AZ10_9PEZI|nr:uncharacterized protein CORC01_10305 [Colletotrichum orchidophilum]OHE94377.1 hypothetical protein CORC01_10305 [Colletotrichum orchidophilum]